MLNLYHHMREIDAIIDEALELQEEEQIPFIQKKCAGNSKLLEEVLDYYSFIRTADEEDFLKPGEHSFPNLMKQAAGAVTDQDFAKRIIGHQIGPYRISKMIGEGGMGTVYLAERVDGDFDRQVAIKFVRGGFYSSYMRQRFAVEKQILSRLDHPNITRLLDGGISDDGTPYLIMEYVDGMPLDRYCQHHKPGFGERIKIFLEICKAVQFAHSKLIVHRDLKPENLLITREGKIKVMDFGIAKMLDPQNDQDSLVQTREGHFNISLEYAAPEQFRNDSPTPATDIYQLGLIFHKLLTDRLPYSIKGSSVMQAERIICETEPQKPNSLLTEVQPNDSELPNVKLFQKQLKGDLDTILLKALQKDPDQRYSSIEMFTGDIDRFLNGYPILAQTATFRYRAGRFIKRHRNRLAVALLIIVTLLGINFHYTTQLSTERDIAQSEADRAEAVKEFLVSMLSEADPYLAPGEPITVRDLLEQNTSEIIEQFTDQPDIALELLYVIGMAQMNLADRSTARLTLEKGTDLIGSDSDELNALFQARYIHTLASTYVGVSERKDELLQQALAFIEGNQNVPLMRSGITSSLAYSAHVNGNYDRAVELIRDAISTSCRPDLLEIEAGWCTRNLFDGYYFLRAGNEIDEAMKAAEKNFRLSAEYFEENHPNRIFAGQLYADALIHQHRPGDAIEIIRQSQDIIKTNHGEDSIRLLSFANLLALAESARGNDYQATIYLKESLNRAMELEPDAINRAIPLNTLVDRLLNLKRLEEAQHAIEMYAYKDPGYLSHHHKWWHNYNLFRINVMSKSTKEIPHNRWLEIVDEFEQNHEDPVPNLITDALNHAIDRNDPESAEYWFDRLSSLDRNQADDVRLANLAKARYLLFDGDYEMAASIIDEASGIFAVREETLGPRIALLHALKAENACQNEELDEGTQLLEKAKQEWIQANGHPSGLATLQQYAQSCK